MFTGSFNRNTHGKGENASRSGMPGSKSVYVRDIDDVKDAFHGSYESPNLDTRADHGSLVWAGLATVVAICIGLGVFALLGAASGTRLDRTEVPTSVLDMVTCRSVSDQVAFSGTFSRTEGAKVAALNDSEGLEIKIDLLDNTGVLVESKTVWMVFDGQAADVPEGALTSIGTTARATFDHAVANPRCVTTIWAA